jgi:hypothetical protein
MLLMLICGVAVGTGLVLTLSPPSEIDPPWSGSPAGRTEVIRRYIWYLTIAVGAGVASGLLIIGAGGRLAMRLLAVTADESAQGRITEADQIVGEITTDGTIGFILFFGILGGLATGILYVLVNKLLPSNPFKGIVFGAVLLVVAGTRIEPLRMNNPDFDIVGPGWVSITVFVALGLSHGALLAALAGRYSKRLPPWSSQRKVLVWYLPLLFIVPAIPLIAFIAVGAGLAVAIHHFPGLVTAIRSPSTLKWSRAIAGVVVLIAAPSFVSALSDIAGRP